jgi:hypothetical protein
MNQRDAYLAEVTEWTRGGRRGPRPSPLRHGFMLCDFTSTEVYEAENRGDPKPPALSNWLWLDHTKTDSMKWHSAIRQAYDGGPSFTRYEMRKATQLYAQLISTSVDE